MQPQGTCYTQRQKLVSRGLRLNLVYWNNVVGNPLEMDTASWWIIKFIPVYNIHSIKCLWEVIQLSRDLSMSCVMALYMGLISEAQDY
jgi:hypothetical protein